MLLSVRKKPHQNARYRVDLPCALIILWDKVPSVRIIDRLDGNRTPIVRHNLVENQSRWAFLHLQLVDISAKGCINVIPNQRFLFNLNPAPERVQCLLFFSSSALKLPFGITAITVSLPLGSTRY